MAGSWSGRLRKELINHKPIDSEEELIEISVSLLVSGGLQEVENTPIAIAKFPSKKAAKRLVKMINHYDEEIISEISENKNNLINKKSFIVVIANNMKAVSRRLELIDLKGKPYVGLPPQFVSTDKTHIASILRACFLTNGKLENPGVSANMSFTVPNFMFALALVGELRRVGLEGKIVEKPNLIKVVIKNYDTIVSILKYLALEDLVTEYESLIPEEKQQSKIKLEALSRANSERSRKAAAKSVARTKDALEKINKAGVELTEAVRTAAELRLANPEDTLVELAGKTHAPRISKDTLSSRLKKLYQISQNIEI
ncbi:MAG: DNA-binding protein WhiA [Candidatus Ancillula sp.]|nr:DNA-binding protein WhiA [Candidatus Ancillula sp.]